jgi:hypothetical protein
MNDTCTYDMYKKDTWYDMYDMYVDKWYMNDMFVDEWYMYDMYMNNIGFACLRYYVQIPNNGMPNVGMPNDGMPNSALMQKYRTTECWMPKK